MSTQKGKIKHPSKAKRSLSSVLAEVLICKKMGWEIEFISVGYGSFDFSELLRYLQAIRKLWGKKLWLNIGYLNEEQIKKLKPLVKGVSVSIETVNWKIRKELCPSKPMGPMIETLRLCDQYGLKKSMTLILGLGEKRTDFQELKRFIAEYGLDQITFYRLKAQKGTIFEGKEELKTEDYLYWIKKTREEFSKIKIVVGSWLGHFSEIHLLLEAGADTVTKFPSIRMFGTKYAQQIEEECSKAGRKFQGSLTKLPQADWKKEIEKAGLTEKAMRKVLQYEKKMERAKH